VIRHTGFLPHPDSMNKRQGGWEGYRFGSAHPSGMNAVFGDGSVRFIRYSVNLTTFNLLGNREDGQVINLGDL
jgi:prepilin-type processing-associated H-X9-DG protein